MSGHMEGDGIASAGAGQGSARGNPPGGGRPQGGGGQGGGGQGGGGGGGNRGRRRRPGEQDDRSRGGERNRPKSSQGDGARGSRDFRNNNSKDRSGKPSGKPSGNKDRGGGGKDHGGSGRPGNAQGNANQRGGKDRQRDTVVATRELSQPTEKALRESASTATEGFHHKKQRYGMALYETFAAAKADLAQLQELTQKFDQLNIVIRAEGNMDDPELNALGHVKVFAGTAWTLIHERRRADGWYEEPR